jgi:hypothetical protein
MDSSTSRMIGTAAVIAVGVGSANAVLRDKRLPSAKFLIGSGVAFLTISALAEAEPEVAKALAGAVATTVVLGEGGGVLSYFDTGEMDTKKRPAPSSARTPVRDQGKARAASADEAPREPVAAASVSRSSTRRTGRVFDPDPLPPYRSDTVSPLY